MADALTLDKLRDAVTGKAAAFRSRTTLQPAGGEGDKVFPPTYAGGVYAVEKRRLPDCDEPVDCVLLDSVQSQANRMEEALQQAVDDGRLVKGGRPIIPVIEVDFSGGNLLTEIGKVTSLQAPHRIADAILRDSLHDGKPFRQSNEGKRIDAASLANATAIFELCPTALVFGMWDSTGPKGGLGAKFQRAMVSEIVGIDAVFGVKTKSRIDPLRIERNAGPLYRRSDGAWTLDAAEAIDELDKSKKPTGRKVLYQQVKGKDVYYHPEFDADKLPDSGRPSTANHGNVVPSLSDFDNDKMRYLAGGITVRSAEQLVTVSLPALRRLKFPVDGGKVDPKMNDAGRTVLAALALCAAALAAEKGFDLRSRCLLWPTEPMRWEVLGRPGEKPEELTLDGDAAIVLLGDAVAAAERVGLKWRSEPLTLNPAPQLLELVKRSQALAAAQGGEAEEGK
jgi:CRISPR-associated protein Csb1